MKTNRAYWWTGVRNFGDALAPLLLERFAGIRVVRSDASQAEIVSIGSVLEHLPPSYSGYILGSGKLKEFSRTDLPAAKILALRGPLSAKGIPGDYAIGDPGLLANELVGPQTKKWHLGIVPHWRDKELAARFTKLIRPPNTTKVIDPRQDPLEVVRQIGACHRIVTSSLHGMIVADAFGIPRRLEICPLLDSEGGDFKFRDYSASINTPFNPGVMMTPSIRLIEDAKFAIFDAYEALASALEVA